MVALMQLVNRDRQHVAVSPKNKQARPGIIVGKLGTKCKNELTFI
jgi:hypothetical protein